MRRTDPIRSTPSQPILLKQIKATYKTVDENDGSLAGFGLAVPVIGAIKGTLHQLVVLLDLLGGVDTVAHGDVSANGIDGFGRDGSGFDKGRRDGGQGNGGNGKGLREEHGCIIRELKREGGEA